METILTIVGYIAAALTFGGMTFFSAVTAPMVFIKLDEKTAGTFIRAMFPWYYLFVIVTAILGALTLLTIVPYASLGLAVAAVLALVSRQGLMPRINGARDQALDGDEEAGKRFDKLHQLSVNLNGIGLVGALAAIVLIAVNAATT